MFVVAVTLFLSTLRQDYEVVLFFVSLHHGLSMTLSEAGVCEITPARTHHGPAVSAKQPPTTSKA